MFFSKMCTKVMSGLCLSEHLQGTSPCKKEALLLVRTFLERNRGFPKCLLLNDEALVIYEQWVSRKTKSQMFY
jgi:hypothetical protein